MKSHECWIYFSTESREGKEGGKEEKREEGKEQGRKDGRKGGVNLF